VKISTKNAWRIRGGILRARNVIKLWRLNATALIDPDATPRSRIGREAYRRTLVRHAVGRLR
jgi:hypothetical protein